MSVFDKIVAAVAPPESAQTRFAEEFTRYVGA
jgi:hypothetical protein